MGQLAWNLQIVLGFMTVPAISDIFFLGSALPITWGLFRVMRERLPAGARTAFTIGIAMITVL